MATVILASLTLFPGADAAFGVGQGVRGQFAFDCGDVALDDIAGLAAQALRRQSQPFLRLDQIAGDAGAGIVHRTQIILRPAMALIRRQRVPAQRFGGVRGDAFAELIEHRDIVLRRRDAGGRHLEIPPCRRALKNSMLPVVTVISIEFAFLMGGLVVTEQVFNLNGLGRLFVESVQNADYTMTQALVMLVSLIFIVTNFVIDIFYAWLDPRIQYG